MIINTIKAYSLCHNLLNLIYIYINRYNKKYAMITKIKIKTNPNPFKKFKNQLIDCMLMLCITAPI